MNKKILALAIPSIISNISVPLVSSVDTVLMGHLSSLHLSALGIVSMIILFLYGTINFLRMGTTGIIAQAFGENNKNSISKTLYRSLIVACLFALIILLFKDTLIKISFYLMNVDKSYYTYAQEYFQIRIYTAPAVFMLYVLMGWFFGMQNAIYPLIVTIIVNVTNIILSYYFVNILHMGIEGAAYGTLIAQYFGLIVSFIFILKYKQYLIFFPLFDILKQNEIVLFLKINKDIFIRTLLLTFSFAFFYSQAAKNSEETLTIMILLLQFVVWFAYTLDGFANAAESLVGKYYGAKDWNSFFKIIKYIFYWGLSITFLYMFFYYTFGENILYIYTNQETLIKNALGFMPYIVFMPILSFSAYIWDGIFIGMTASNAMRNITIWSVVFYLFLFYTTKEINFSYSLWISFMLFFFFRGLFQTILFIKYGRTLK